MSLRFYEAAKIYNSKIIVRITQIVPLLILKLWTHEIKLLIDKKKDTYQTLVRPLFQTV